MVGPTVVGLAAASCMVSSIMRTLMCTKYKYVTIIIMQPFVFTYLFMNKNLKFAWLFNMF